MTVCQTDDEFVFEKLKWVVELSDGTKIYQDDNRPGENEPTAWIRLARYLTENKLNIKRFFLQFFDHVEEVAPQEQAAYYFSRVAEAFQGFDQTFEYYLIGWLTDGDELITVNKWKVPEIIMVSTETRKVVDGDVRLIRNVFGK